MISSLIAKEIEQYFNEDQLGLNHYYLSNLPNDLVECQLKIKSDLVLSGLQYFVSSFNFLGAQLNYEDFKKYEGQKFNKGEVINFNLPFNIALSGERVALNLLQRSSSVSTFTNKFAEITWPYGIKILDTRKTTPGLRSLEKYAVRIGGGHNHRFTQSDVWMIKDNHKTFFGGLKEAVSFFSSMQTMYQNMVVEIHSIEELKLAQSLNIQHVMLDNFSKENLQTAVEMKTTSMTYEISGGVNLSNIHEYCIKGIDAISIGALTHSAPHVDLSMKIRRL